MPTITRNGCDLYFESHGEGPALVFAHGMGGSHLSWYQQIPYFVQRGRRPIAFDHRGFGSSRCAPEDWHPREFPHDLFAILDALDVERAALVCQSMGGWTGLPAAIARPERVSGLVLCGTPGGLAIPEVAKAREEAARRIRAEGVRANAALAPDFPEREPEKAFLYDRLSALNPGLAPEALARMAEPSAQVEVDALADYAVPTLVLSGSHDLLFPPDLLRAVADRIPGAEFVPFPGSGHSTYFEQPARFNEVVASFLERLDP